MTEETRQAVCAGALVLSVFGLGLAAWGLLCRVVCGPIADADAGADDSPEDDGDCPCE